MSCSLAEPQGVEPMRTASPKRGVFSSGLDGRHSAWDRERRNPDVGGHIPDPTSVEQRDKFP